MSGTRSTGRVVNVTDFGLFIDIYEGLEGLAHVSEIDLPAGKLEDLFTVGEWARARILRIEEEDHKVGLTMRGVDQPTAEEIAELDEKFGPHVPAAVVTASEEEDSEGAELAAAAEEESAPDVEASAAEGGDSEEETEQAGSEATEDAASEEATAEGGEEAESEEEKSEV